jgi:uncharacterized protein (TIGR02246 family)
MRATYVILAAAVLAAVFLTIGAGAVAQPPKSDPPATAATALSADDDKAVRKVIQGFEEAWNAHDMKAFGKLLREDAEWVNIVGMHWKGREAVVAAHDAFHKTMFKDHRMKTDGVELRSLGGGHVIAVVTTTNDAFTTPGGQVMPKAQNRQTYVLTKEPGGWRIAHCQNVRVDAEAVKNDPVGGKK